MTPDAIVGAVLQIERIVDRLPVEKSCFFDPAPYLRALVYLSNPSRINPSNRPHLLLLEILCERTRL